MEVYWQLRGDSERTHLRRPLEGSRYQTGAHEKNGLG
jgi:hypothetical protein